MNIRRRLLGGAAAALCMGLAVSACSGDQEADALPLGSTGSLGGEASTPVPGDPSGPGSGREVPASCASLTLALGAALDGTVLGECVSQALASFGSGTLAISGDQNGEVDFTYDPDYSFHGEFGGKEEGELRSLTFVDGVMWVDTGNGPVKGDPNSDDPEEQLAGVVAALYSYYSDPAQTAALVAGQPNWTVRQERESVRLPDGSTVNAFTIVSDGPFTWNEMPVSEYVLWFGDDWVPVGSEATVSAFGVTSTNSQQYYNLGAPVTITAPY